MFIALPLTLLGVGFMIYFLFAAATYVLPLYAGLSAGFAALHVGTSYTGALLLGIAAFLLVFVLSQVVVQLTPSRPARIGITLLLAVPAAIAGFQVAAALLHFGGVGSWGVGFALAAALATGVAAAKRYALLPHD